MNISLLTVPLKHKRDLLRARHHVRQAADLLGYSAQDQTCLIAAAFDLAYQALRPTGRAKLQLDIVDNCLLVVCTPVTRAQPRQGITADDSLRLSKRLPASAPLPREDVPWMLKQLTELAACELLEEVCKINRELLETLLELAKCQPQQPDTVPTQKETSAA